MGLLIWL